MMWPTVVAWYMNAGTSLFTLTYLLAMLFESLMYINLSDATRSDYEYVWYAILVAQGLVVAALYTIYLQCRGTLCARFQQNFNLVAGAIALVFTVGGIVAKATTINQPSYYWWQHSLWHIGTAIGIAACHAMWNTKVICCQRGQPSDFDPFNAPPPPPPPVKTSVDTLPPTDTLPQVDSVV
jgi:hypothetical protein